jgi:hypothetical protein
VLLSFVEIDRARPIGYLFAVVSARDASVTGYSRRAAVLNPFEHCPLRAAGMTELSDARAVGPRRDAPPCR